MTREQAHDLMENELRCVQRGNYCDRDCAKCPLVKDDKELIEAYGYVIKSLEQQPKTDVLDKIRAEIKKLKNAPPCFDDMFEYKCAVDDVLAIIDKYKAESEEEK